METTVQSDPAQQGQLAPPQTPAATAGQPAPMIQEIIVPESDWRTYVAYIQNKYPFMHVQATQISDLQAAQDVADGKAMRIVKKNLTGEGSQAVAFDTKHMLDNLNIPAAEVPQFIEGLATQLGQFAAKNNSGAQQKEEKTMENNNNAQVAQAQQSMFEQMKAQAESISWSRVAKGVGLVGGGVVIGKFAFGGKSANPQTAEALLSAAETMSKADPKAIANALGTIGKTAISKIFSI